MDNTKIDTKEAIVMQGLVGEKAVFAVEYVIYRAKYSYQHFSEYTRLWLGGQYLGHFDEPEILGMLGRLEQYLEQISQKLIPEGAFDYEKPKQIFRLLEKDSWREQHYDNRICDLPAYAYFNSYAVRHQDEYIFIWQLRREKWEVFPDYPKKIMHHRVSKDYADRVIIAWNKLSTVAKETFTLPV
jgi:hypothetical protein